MSKKIKLAYTEINTTLEKEVLENHTKYLERKKTYLSYGFDIDQERQLVLDKAKPLSGNILEVGTGKGHFAIMLAKQGYNFTSVDISAEEQRTAKLNLRYFGLDGNVNLMVENAEHLSFKDQSFDVIFSVNVLHHLDAPFKVIDEFIRVLAPKGKIVLSDFTTAGFDILDKIHSDEGTSHDKGATELIDVDTYLVRKGFKTEKHSSKFQDILIAYK